MGRIPLASASYAGQSVIASGQECVNLYAESNANIDPQSPVPITYYQTPGSVLFVNPNVNAKVRGEYRTSVDTAYFVVGPSVFYLSYDAITQTPTAIQIGSIADTPSQVYFKDNGLCVVLVDGISGYVIDMASNAFSKIIDPNFYSSDFVDLLDTFFIFNNSGTNQFFISLSNASYGLLSSTAILAGSITTAGAAYTNGTYNNVALTGGSGAGATANITVAGNAVTAVNIVTGGKGYAIGDVLSANAADIGGTGAGFVWTFLTPDSAFDPLDIAAKSGFNDPIVGLVVVHRELWLIGTLTSEVWVGTGAADFYFQEVQGAFINHGSSAAYSIASQDVLIFFLQQDQQGNGLVLQGQGYDVTEISTPRLVEEFKSYDTIADAIGFCFQISDHSFYALVFPIANKAWLYDLTTKQWLEWNWTDINGKLNRHRANCCMFAFGLILVGDFENGNILRLDPDIYTDYFPATPTGPITRIKTFPHITGKNYERVSYKNFDADIAPGTIEQGALETIQKQVYLKGADGSYLLGADGQLLTGMDTIEVPPEIFLSWSDNKGVSYGNPVGQSMGKIGQYETTVSWNRLGMARDRVFKLQWSANLKTALNGGFVETAKARS
jgi:hypothetical protein